MFQREGRWQHHFVSTPALSSQRHRVSPQQDKVHPVGVYSITHNPLPRAASDADAAEVGGVVGLPGHSLHDHLGQ